MGLIRTAQQARERQAEVIAERWARECPSREAVRRALSAYVANPQALQMGGHLVSACRRRGLI